MPLLDHFHPPLSVRRPWEAFHGAWAATIAQQLNGRLPPFYVALPLVQLGGRVEIDVAAAKETNGASQPVPGAGGVATAVWSPSRPAIRIPVDFTNQDAYEVRVFREEGGLTLRAAIELVSPGNKDRPSHRRAFAAKCASYLAQGASVVIVDIVTDRQANLHAELIEVLQLAGVSRWESATRIYAIAYRTGATGEQVHLEAWPEALTLGASLPTLPLWLEADMGLPLELEPSYQATCNALRMG